MEPVVRRERPLPAEALEREPPRALGQLAATLGLGEEPGDRADELVVGLGEHELIGYLHALGRERRRDDRLSGRECLEYLHAQASAAADGCGDDAGTVKVRREIGDG